MTQANHHIISSITKDVGTVIIGRNEGDRLITCLKSVLEHVESIVYVDSGSSDGSPENANTLGAKVISLDMSKPFTAARARNAGFQKLKEIMPHIKHVQFVDGDCEIQNHWLKLAQNFLLDNEQVAIVCGRRRERYPHASIYNELCDFEWDTPVGQADSCGGDSLIRADIFENAGGFRDDLIAGEEPELCVRIRALGWQIWRLDQEMTLHDADMHHFIQWWRRAQRAGYAFFLGASLHALSKERFWIKECVRILLWGGLIPIATVFLSLHSSSFLLLFLIYPCQWLRLFLRKGSSLKQVNMRFKASWAWFTVLGKFAEFTGFLKFLYDKLRNRKAHIIEYK